MKTSSILLMCGAWFLAGMLFSSGGGDEQEARAETNVAFSDVDLVHVNRVVLIRGSGTLIDWQMHACGVSSNGVNETCGPVSGTMSQANSNSARNLIKTIMLPAFCAAKNLNCAP